MDVFHFMWTALRHPRGVAAVCPSGPALAELITSGITSRTGPVLELGPGTGVFTQALIVRGCNACDLTLIEREEHFVKVLRNRYQTARVLHMDAARLVGQALCAERKFGAVVCGLPLLSMSTFQVVKILIGAFRSCCREASFYLFTYGPRCPVPDAILTRLNLAQERIGGTVRNVPPASVYKLRCRKPKAGCTATGAAFVHVPRHPRGMRVRPVVITA